jgi:hypothetical protein
MAIASSFKVTPAMLVKGRARSRTLSVGTTAFDSKTGYRYVYITAGAAIAQYDACRVVADLSDVRPTSAVNQPVLGVAQAAIASGASGWIQTHGKMTCKVVVATAAGSPLVTNATAGTLALADATGFAAPGRGIALVTGVAAGSAIWLS